MKGYIEAAVKLYSGDKPLDLFVQKLPENVRLMDARFEEIASVFRAEGVEDFMKLPPKYKDLHGSSGNTPSPMTMVRWRLCGRNSMNAHI